MSNKKPNIVVLGGGAYARLFAEHGNVRDYEDSLKGVNLVVFTGGADVWPGLYGEKTGRLTRCSLERDMLESSIFDEAVGRGIPMAGICRGAQFLTVKNGGKLFQHVYNHGIFGEHGIETNEGKVYEVTSTHHQMMNPWNMDAGDFEVLAWSEIILSDKYFNGNDEEVQPPIVEPEVVWYPKTRSLAMQFHPEYMPKDSAGRNYCQQLVRDYLL